MIDPDVPEALRRLIPDERIEARLAKILAADGHYREQDESDEPGHCTSRIAHESGLVLRCLLGAGHPVVLHQNADRLWDVDDDRVIYDQPVGMFREVDFSDDDEPFPTCTDCGATLTLNGCPTCLKSAAWRDGVRWAAAEADAQASWREPVYILDVTDHLRLCASDPQRRSVVAREQAPKGDGVGLPLNQLELKGTGEAFAAGRAEGQAESYQRGYDTAREQLERRSFMLARQSKDAYAQGARDTAAKIAREIRRELVCCDVYERLAPQRAVMDASDDGGIEASGALDDAIDGHELCYWGEASALIAESVGSGDRD